jgi:hypothetical protein
VLNNFLNSTGGENVRGRVTVSAALTVAIRGETTAADKTRNMTRATTYVEAEPTLTSHTDDERPLVGRSLYLRVMSPSSVYS